MLRDNNPAPHTCGDCGEPAYHGFNMPGKCVQFGCAFYDADLFAEWVMWLPDVEDPTDFDDEDTSPGIDFYSPGVPTPGFLRMGIDPYATDRQLDAVGQLLGLTRTRWTDSNGDQRDESDEDYRQRLTDFYRKAP